MNGEAPFRCAEPKRRADSRQSPSGSPRPRRRRLPGSAGRPSLAGLRSQAARWSIAARDMEGRFICVHLRI